MLRFARALCLSLAALSAAPVAAQDAAPGPAALVADNVVINNRARTLTAEGNVEAFYDGGRLMARRITYIEKEDRLYIEGPIRLTDADGNIVVATEAELDPELRNGVLMGARLVLDEQLQIASNRLDRVDGRYSQLSRAAATSCQVCGPNSVPLWQIRARRVVHDNQERQLYFDDAHFRVLDVPIFYMPRLRIPDPTLKRARGFLIPYARSTTRLGTGIKLPYFIPIGDDKDLTLTPYLSPFTRTLEFRYRQAFAKGDLEINGAATNDTLLPGQFRGYLFADGTFRLPKGYRLRFDVEMTTDEGYLASYGYSGKDRLDSAITVTRTKRDRYFEAGLVHYESLRDGENNATQPTLIGDILYEQRHFPSLIGGEARLELAAHSHFRYSNAAFAGRDITRLHAKTDWRRRWTLPGGLRAGLTGGVSFDTFSLSQAGPGFSSSVVRAVPSIEAELRWPLIKHEQSGGRQILEPIAQIGWTRADNSALPNDESTRVEFDEANLLSIARFPAPDRVESGLSYAMGVRWKRHDPKGWSAGLTLGQVIRETEIGAMTRSSGLDGLQSDLLIAGQFRNKAGFSLTLRGLYGGRDDVPKAEARAGWSKNRLKLGATYLLLGEDPEEDRAQALSEWTLDASYRIADNWTVSTDWRYDLITDRPARTGFGIEYRNECVDVALSASRSYATSTSLTPSTDFGLTIALKGFSTGGSAKDFRRTCRN